MEEALTIIFAVVGGVIFILIGKVEIRETKQKQRAWDSSKGPFEFKIMDEKGRIWYETITKKEAEKKGLRPDIYGGILYIILGLGFLAFGLWLTIRLPFLSSRATPHSCAAVPSGRSTVLT